MTRPRVVNGVGEIGHNVASNVRRLRAGQGMSTTKLSKALGDHGRPITATGITRIEWGNRAIDVDDLVALARVFNVEPAILLCPAPVCATCRNEPPAGFKCRVCGAEG
jgi:transcriptional regulator with XRE-family HTH domain